MNGNSRIRVALSPVILMAIGLVIISCSENRDPEFKLAPKALPEATQADTPANKGVEVGTGWGEGKPAEAVRKALGMALKGKANKNPDFMIIHPTAGSDCEKILQE